MERQSTFHMLSHCLGCSGYGSCVYIFNRPFCQLIDVFPNIVTSQRRHLPEIKWETHMPVPVPQLSGGGVRRCGRNSSPATPICKMSKQTSSKNVSHVHFVFFFSCTFYWSSWRFEIWVLCGEFSPIEVTTAWNQWHSMRSRSFFLNAREGTVPTCNFCCFCIMLSTEVTLFFQTRFDGHGKACPSF